MTTRRHMATALASERRRLEADLDALEAAKLKPAAPRRGPGLADDYKLRPTPLPAKVREGVAAALRDGAFSTAELTEFVMETQVRRAERPAPRRWAVSGFGPRGQDGLCAAMRKSPGAEGDE